MRLTVLVIASALAAASRPVPADAGTKAGVTMPDTVSVDGKQLVLNGMGLRTATILHVHVYVAGLYVEHATSSADQILAPDQAKQLVLHFVRDVARGDILKAWHEAFARSHTVPMSQLQPMIDRLDSWMPNFRNGATLTFTFVPGQGLAVDVDGARKGVIPDAEFARTLFEIWLGPHPPAPGLQRGLLGGGGRKT